MKKKKRTAPRPGGALVVLPGGRKELPVSRDALALTLAAARLMYLVGRVDEALDEVDLQAFDVPTNLNKVRSYFRQRGVSFSSNGRPVLPAGELVGCDLQWLSREALSLALCATLALGLEDEGVLADELWISLGRHSLADCRDGGHPVLPIVLAINPHTMCLSHTGGARPFVQLNHPGLVATLKSLLDQQQPDGWKSGLTP
jgi:hypothetical protein